jgi:hypothetical protein
LGIEEGKRTDLGLAAGGEEISKRPVRYPPSPP